MRLILKLPIILILIFSSGKMAAQVQVDTIAVKHTFLEERHLRYMYNFMLNNTFFQFRSGVHRIEIPHLIKKSGQSELNFVLNHKFLIRMEDLKLFIQPDSLLKVYFVDNFDHDLESVGFISQFDFEYIQLTDQELKRDFLQKKLFESPNSRYAVQFSNVLIRGNKIYLSIKISFPVNYDPDFVLGNYQMYEFEWCESVGWVYPRRVSKHDFNTVYDMNKPRSGGTVEIPSLKCYPSEK